MATEQEKLRLRAQARLRLKAATAPNIVSERAATPAMPEMPQVLSATMRAAQETREDAASIEQMGLGLGNVANQILGAVSGDKLNIGIPQEETSEMSDTGWGTAGENYATLPLAGAGELYAATRAIPGLAQQASRVLPQAVTRFAAAHPELMERLARVGAATGTAATEGAVMAPGDAGDAVDTAQVQGGTAGVLSGALEAAGAAAGGIWSRGADVTELLRRGITPSAGQWGNPMSKAAAIPEQVYEFLGGRAARRPVQEMAEEVAQRGQPFIFQNGRRVPVPPSRHEVASPQWFTDVGDNQFSAGYDSLLNTLRVPADNVRTRMSQAIMSPDLRLKREDATKLAGRLEDKLQAGGFTPGSTLTGRQWKELRSELANDLADMAPDNPDIKVYRRMLEAMEGSLQGIPGFTQRHREALGALDDRYGHFLQLQRAGGMARKEAAPLSAEHMQRAASNTNLATSAQETGRNQKLLNAGRALIDEPILGKALGRKAIGLATSGAALHPVTAPIAIPALVAVVCGTKSGSRT